MVRSKVENFEKRERNALLHQSTAGLVGRGIILDAPVDLKKMVIKMMLRLRTKWMAAHFTAHQLRTDDGVDQMITKV